MGWRAAKSGTIGAVADPNDVKTEECKYLLDGITGQTIVAALPDGSIKPVKATIGITHVFSQTQLTRERHHLTHMSQGKYSLGTTPGRAAGGGVAAAEMEYVLVVSILSHYVIVPFL